VRLICRRSGWGVGSESGVGVVLGQATFAICGMTDLGKGMGGERGEDVEEATMVGRKV
jgi:hypothetical protein